MEEVSKLKSDLESKLAHLRTLHDHPRLQITEFFFGLRNEIDVEAEGLLGSSSNGGASDARVNAIRNELIQFLKRKEQELLDAVNDEAGDAKKTLFHSELEQKSARIEQQIAELFNPASTSSDGDASLNDYEDHYERLACELIDETDRVERELLGSQTFLFIPTESCGDVFGVLLHLDQIFLTRHEARCLKKLVMESSSLDLESSKLFSFIHEFVETSINESLSIHVQKPHVISKNTLIIVCLQDYLTNAIKEGAWCFPFSFDKRVLDSRLEASSKQDREVKAIHFNQKYEFIARNLGSKSIDAIESDAFDFLSTAISRLDLSDNRLQSLDFYLPISLQKLCLNDNSFVKFEEKRLRELTSLQVLQMMNAFRPGMCINLNFLGSFTHLENLSLSLSETPLDFNIFKNLTRMVYLHLEAAIGGKQRTMLDQESIGKLSHMTRLKFLALANFQIERIEREDLTFTFQSLESLFLDNDKIRDLDRSVFTYVSFNLSHLSLSKNQIVRITQDLFKNLSYVKVLDLNLNSIDKLSAQDFQGLRSLQVLYLEGNHLTSLPLGVFENLPCLHLLNLSKNKIKTISAGVFNTLSGLEYLKLDGNPIETIESGAFLKLETLHELNLSECQLRLIDNLMFSGLLGLDSLSLAKNKIETFEIKLPGKEAIRLDSANLSAIQLDLAKKHMFSDLKKLGFLDLSGNRFEKLDLNIFYNLESLHCLDVSGNRISEINARAQDGLFKYLRTLSLENNKLRLISSLAFQTAAQALWDLNLSKNELEKIDDYFFKAYANLESLNLENNQLDMAVNDSTFSSQASLIQLRLGSNKCLDFKYGSLGFLSSLVVLSLDGPKCDLSINLRGLNKILKLHVHNSTQAIVEGLVSNLNKSKQLLSSIALIDFSSSSIASLDKIELCHCFPNLKELTLASNNLTTFKESWLEGLESLTKLDVSNNQIEVLDMPSLFAGLKHLYQLNLSGNKLRHVNRCLFKGCFNLTVLDLSRNALLSSLDEGQFRELKNLEEINLSQNSISRLKIAKLFAKNRLLNVIDLSGNLLDNESLHERSFENTDLSYKLKVLNLEKNNLRDAGFIRNLTRLEKLDLSGNQIESIDRAIFARLTSLKQVNLGNNKQDLLVADFLKDLNISLVK